MTIGIGVICSEGKQKPDRIILASDSLGSFGDDYSTSAHRKLMWHEETKLYATGADDLEHCGDVFKKIIRDVSKLPNRSYPLIHDAIAHAAWDHRSARFKYDVLPEFQIEPSNHWKAEAKEAGVMKKIERRWKKFTTNVLMIVSTFDENGEAIQFLVMPDGAVQSFILPGFVAIGSGGANAMFWLAFRDQNLTMGLFQSAYHVYEAKRMAERSPHVGKDDIEIVFASSEGKYFTSARTPPPGDYPALAELEELWKQFGPHDTNALEVAAEGLKRKANVQTPEQ